MNQLILGLLILLLGGPAQAATVQFQGALTFVGGFQPTDNAVGTGVAVIGSTPSGQLTKFRFSNDIFTGSRTVPLTDPENATLVSMIGSARLGAGTLSNSDMKLPVKGSLKLCLLFPGCGTSFTIPMTVNGTAGVGIGGQLTVNTFSVGGGLKVSLVGAPWTVGPITFNERTPNGGLSEVKAHGGGHGPSQNVNTTAIDPAQGGVFSLVTPVVVHSDGGVQEGAVFMTVKFVPEPGVGISLLIGVGGLVLAWHRRNS